MFSDINKLDTIQARLRKVVNTSPDPFTAVRAVFEQLAEPLELDVYFNYIAVDGMNELFLSSYEGIPVECAEDIRHLGFGHAVCGTVAMMGNPIVVCDVQNSTEPKVQLIRSLGVRVYRCEPLLANGKLFGTMSFGSRRRTEFTEQEQAIISLAADLISSRLATIFNCESSAIRYYPAQNRSAD